MRNVLFPTNEFKTRRQKLKEFSPSGAFLFAAAPAVKLGSYRQDSDLFYLSGFEEPESWLLIRPGKDPETVLFVKEKDPVKETWDGFLFGPDAARDTFEVDACFLNTEFSEKAIDLLADCSELYFRLGRNENNDRMVLDILSSVKAKKGRSGLGLLPIHDPQTVVGELRLFKSELEIKAMREVAQLSAKAHVEIMKWVKPGLSERQVQGKLIQMFMQEGAQREAYSSIVAGGANATVLHYIFNDQLLKDGDLLLIDAGADKNYYCGDITRTFPVNGKFSIVQKEFYERVLHAQKSLVDMVAEGLPYQDMQSRAVDMLTDAMIEFKLLNCSKDQALEDHLYRKYYPHGAGHYLGIDVHDVGLYIKDKKPRTLENGMCFTVEPGLYVPADDQEAPKELRGLGVRIEDDILVSEGGAEVLTAGVPKETDEIESLMNS